MNKQKDQEFINEGNQSSVDNTNDTNPSPLQRSDNETKIKQTGGGVNDRSAPILNRDEITSKDPQPVEQKEPDLTIGSKPWARKWAGGDGTSYRDANAATEELLTKEGWDLRGLGIAQKQDLFSDYRLGRLQETDKGLFFNNKLIRKR